MSNNDLSIPDAREDPSTPLAEPGTSRASRASGCFAQDDRENGLPRAAGGSRNDVKDGSREISKPGYYAVIPAKVRYDETLRPNAKLLYAEITALTSARGYCWASNERLGEFFGLAPKTVGSLIQQLAERGYLAVEMVRNESRAITGRRIWIDRPRDVAPPILKNEDTPLKNEDTPLLKNEEESIKSDIINPPIAPQGACASSTPKWKPERFEAFWRYYPAIPDGNGRGRRPAKDRAARAWDKLHADDSEIDLMAAALQRQKLSRQWRDGVGIPYASTWLNRREWRDEVEDLRAAEGVGPYEERGSAPRKDLVQL